MEQARCRHYPPDWWSVPHPRNETALAICHGCPVKRECAEHAKALDMAGTIVAGETRCAVKQAPGARACVHCGSRFMPNNHKQLACTRRCHDTAYTARRRSRG
jgi:hypothetical protein